jgi:hypothetical protein
MQSYMASAVTVLPEVPAETLLWMATSPEAGASADNALDDNAAKRLWLETENLLASYGFGGTRSMCIGVDDALQSETVVNKPLASPAALRIMKRFGS